MINNYLEKTYLFLLLFIPISIIIGSAISLLNILILLLIFLFFSIRDIKKNLFYNREIILLIGLYFYLIFNSFVAIDFEISANRNFGFIRFLLLFVLINFIFKKYKFQDNLFKFWSLVLIIVVCDSFLEFFTGRNSLGYGELYGSRIVSFFKDEPIVGGFLNGFIFIIIGFYFDRLINKDFKFKILLILLIFVLFFGVIITGERSNGIKLLFGLLLFLILNSRLNIKIKIITLIGIFVFFLAILLNSNYLKSRYYDGFVYHLTDSDRLSTFVQKQEYFELYRSGIAVFKDHPFFGVGNKNYRVVTIKYEGIRKDYEISTHPHQVYVELLSEHGAIGTIIILSIIFFLMFKNLKIIILSRNSLQLGCFIYLVIGFIPLLPGGSFFSDFPSTLFWLNLSIMYASNPKTNIFNIK